MAFAILNTRRFRLIRTVSEGFTVHTNVGSTAARAGCCSCSQSKYPLQSLQPDTPFLSRFQSTVSAGPAVAKSNMKRREAECLFLCMHVLGHVTIIGGLCWPAHAMRVHESRGIKRRCLSSFQSKTAQVWMRSRLVENKGNGLLRCQLVC